MPETTSAPLRILYVVYGFFDAGAERLTFELARRMQKRGGCLVAVVAINEAEAVRERAIRDSLEQEGIQASVLLPQTRVSNFTKALFKLFALCRKFQPDVIHSHCEVPDLVSRLVASVTRTMHVSTAHNTEHWPWRPRLGRLLERSLIGITRHHIAVSNAVGQFLENELRVPRKRFSVVPNTIEQIQNEVTPAERAPLGLKQDDFVILVVGRVDHQKGPDIFLKAMAKLTEKHPRIRAIWAGDGPLLTDMETRAKDLKIDHVVSFLGVRTDVPALLKTSNLFVLPSRFEGLPLVLLEAMGAGTPVVASRLGGVQEVVTDESEGLLVEPGDSAALASSILRIYHDPELAERLAQRALTRISRRKSPDEVAELHGSLYRRLMQGRRLRQRSGNILRRAALWARYKLGTAYQPILPVTIDLEPVNTCNFRCPHCQVTHWKKEASRLESEGFTNLLKQFPFLQSVKLQGMGEPLLNRRLPEMIREGEEHGLEMSLISNGSIVSDSIKEKLCSLDSTTVTFSLDGASAGTFERIRVRGNFERVCRNIAELVDYRNQTCSSLTIQIWTVVTRENIDELEEIVALARQLGVDGLTFQPFLSDWGKDEIRHEILAMRIDAKEPSTDEMFVGAERLAKNLGLPLTVYRSNLLTKKKKCSWPWTSTFIAANGDVVPCCIIADSDTAKMGNIFEKPFKEIWNSNSYRELRNRLRNHDLPDYCRNCYANED